MILLTANFSPQDQFVSFAMRICELIARIIRANITGYTRRK